MTMQAMKLLDQKCGGMKTFGAGGDPQGVTCNGASMRSPHTLTSQKCHNYAFFGRGPRTILI
ncbi:hypothetical protein BZM27_22765 [Paraburkholderia steynii]|uniref:Uncharacterized protein n=1 Tax=Paraburkholderia steynii TaxID=1245441 RepID=A0A4R0X9H7_9BURK|nr:hypothetical protein BZM27_22765 [Paraburkholderia steynii]